MTIFLNTKNYLIIKDEIISSIAWSRQGQRGVICCRQPCSDTPWGRGWEGIKSKTLTESRVNSKVGSSRFVYCANREIGLVYITPNLPLPIPHSPHPPTSRSASIGLSEWVWWPPSFGLWARQPYIVVSKHAERVQVGSRESQCAAHASQSMHQQSLPSQAVRLFSSYSVVLKFLIIGEIEQNVEIFQLRQLYVSMPKFHLKSVDHEPSFRMSPLCFLRRRYLFKKVPY